MFYEGKYRRKLDFKQYKVLTCITVWLYTANDKHVLGFVYPFTTPTLSTHLTET